LYLMNDKDVLAAADAFAERLLALQVDEDARIEQAFLRALGRKPNGTDLAAVRRFLREFPMKLTSEPAERRRGKSRASEGKDTPKGTWSAFVQTLFQCAEFRYQS
jgi:Protein of unknown function (DUF1553)